MSLTIYFPGEGGTQNMSPGASNTITGGTITNMGTELYTASIPCSGDFDLTNFTVQFNIDGNIYTLSGCGSSTTITPGNNATFTINYTVPNGEGCSTKCTYKVNLVGQSSGSNYYQQQTVNVVNPTFSGTTDICYPTSSEGYSLTFYGTISNPGSRTWSISGSGWLINGSNPYSTTANSVTVTVPSQASNATLTISGTNANLCSTMTIPVEYNTGPPSTPTTLTYNRLAGTCYYSVTTNSISTATSYYWSCVSDFSDQEITSTNTTTEVGPNCPDLLQNTTVPIYIKTHSGCGFSTNVFYKNTTFPPIKNCENIPNLDSTFRPETNSINNFNPDSFRIRSIGNGVFNVTITTIIDNLQVQIFSLDGQLLKSINPQENEFQIDLSNRPDGLYLISVCPYSPPFC